MSNKIEIFRGISWMSGLQLIIRFLTIVKTSLLARLLSPFEFGIFGIAALVLAFFEILTETGVNVFLIQQKKNLSEYINSAWVVSIIRGVLISFAMLLSAGFISRFFQSPESYSVLLLLSLVPFVRGFINPSSVKFQKELKFNLEFSYKTLLFTADAIIAILFALITKSAASLAWGMLGAALLEVILSMVFVKPTPVFSIDRKYLSEIFHKGKWVTMYGILDYFGKQGDDIAVGKIIGSQALGLYQVAYRISTLAFTEITEVVNKVFFPFYSQVDDKEKLKRIFVKSYLVLSFIVVNLSLLVYFFAEQIVLILLGDQWVAAIPILQVLAFYGMIRAIVSFPTSLFLALHFQKYVAMLSAIRAATLTVSVIPFIIVFGILGATYSAILSVLVEIPLVVYLVIKIFKKSW